MALPEGYDFKQYLPTEADFALVLECKQNGKAYKLTHCFYPINEPFYYEGVRLYLACILLKWEEGGKLLESYLLSGQNYNRYSTEDLKEIRTLAMKYKGLFINAYNKYRDEGHSLESPEKRIQQARDSRKGEITVRVKNPNGGFFRIIEYSMKYGDYDPNKKQNGARMHLYINKKQGNIYGISIRGSNTFGSNRTELDEPFFASIQEARDFIANIDHQHIETAVTLEDWRFVISDKPVDYAWDQATRTYIKKADLIGAKKIETVCGPCYMLDKCRFFENLQEKIIHLSNGDWQVQSEKGRNMGTYETKKEAEKRLSQVEYFKHMNESQDNEIEILHYKKLPVRNWFKVADATEISPEDWDYEDIYVQYDYEIEKNFVKDALWNIIADKAEFSKVSDKDLSKYIDDNYDDLLNKYYIEVLKFYEADAIDEYEKYKDYDESLKEAIEKHDILNPKIFENNKLKPEVRQKAEEVVNEFLKILAEDEVKLIVRDVILTGSNASFNYTENSDIDLHILAKTADLEDPDKLYPKIYNCYRRIFENKFDISFYGIPVETYVEVENNPVVSNGIYSVMYDRWVKEPSAVVIPEIDQKAIDAASKPWIDEAKKLIKEVDDNIADGEEKIDDYITRLYELRQKGIYSSVGNEYSTENLTFKEVRNAGLLDKLKKLKNVIISKKLSLEEGIKYLDDDHEFKDYGTSDAHETDVIDIHKASTFSTQDLLDGSVDAAYDGVIYEIVEMTPTQYFELCGKIQGIKPDEIIDFISTDERQITHIKDVILKYGKKLPLPFVSFSDNIEVSGQEGRHRMYALGEMFGWDEDFPVMLIQDASSKKTLGELLHESIIEDFYLDEKTRRDYVIKIAQIAHDQPIVHQNGMFELYNISEQDANFIISTLRHMPWVEYVSKSGGKYDYSKMSYQGIPALKLSIIGKIKFN